jgi:hypothetical protein
MAMNRARNQIFSAFGQATPYSLLFAGVIIKYFTTGGIFFNTKLWDWERDMFDQVDGRDFFSYLMLRDSVGYSIIPMRSVVWGIAHLADGEMRAIFLRLIVIFIQVGAFYCATLLLSPKTSNATRAYTFFLLIFLPVEDVNYIHHVGYLLLFPQLLMINLLEKRKLKESFILVLLIVFFLNKPINAILLIVYITLKYLTLKKSDLSKTGIISFYFILVGASSIYLLAYLILPRDLGMQLISPSDNLIQLLINIPYIVSVIVFPAITIGLVGFVKLLSFDSWIPFIGLFCLFTTIILLICAFQKRKVLWKTATLKEQRDDNLILSLFLVSYFMVYTIGNFYWVTVFPLWELSYPAHIWMRWSVTPAVLLVLLIMNWIDRNSQPITFSPIKSKKNTSTAVLKFNFILLQYIFLWILAHSYLQRWWIS